MNIVLEIIIFNVVVFTICGINMAKKGRLGLIQKSISATVQIDAESLD